VQDFRARPSVQDVARLAGVSLGTVSNVLNNPGRVTPGTLAKVTKAIDQLGFVRNDAARQLKAGKSKTIGLILLDSANPFFSDLASGAEDEALPHGHAVIIGNTAVKQDREANYLGLFEEQRVAGIVISPMGDVTGEVLKLRDRGTPAVLADRKADPKICCSVSMDDFAGGKLAVQHLLDRGAKRIAFVGGPMEFEQIAQRLLGAKEAVASSPGATLEVIPSQDLTVLTGRAIGEQIIARPREERPRAIFAANDLLAVGLMQAFVVESRIRIPEDIMLIGYDDIDFASAAIVPLSSVNQNAKLLGAKAVELLFDEIENPEGHQHQALVFQPELVVRASSS